jgi:hypothetical protein
MSFREKSAWISLLTIVVVAVMFMLEIPRPWTWTLTPAPSGFLFRVLFAAIATFVVIAIVAHLVVAALAPRDARAQGDERERLIALKATRLAGLVYAVLSLGSIALIHYGANQIALGYAVLLSFVVAEAVNYAARIAYFRRGV